MISILLVLRSAWYVVILLLLWRIYKKKQRMTIMQERQIWMLGQMVDIIKDCGKELNDIKRNTSS